MIVGSNRAMNAASWRTCSASTSPGRSKLEAMSSGGQAGIVAIPPRTRHPQTVWGESVRQGKLRRAGHGLDELRDEP